jgi:hypothetical protein
MSDEFSSVPIFTFTTLKNAELGAQSVARAEDGSIVVTGILKKVTESMLQSYPRVQLGKWTPNREAIRFTPEQAEGRGFKRLDNGASLSIDQLLAL